jgi:hypothetical protein
VPRRTTSATALAFRDQLRRPLVPILLVAVPAVIVVWSVATTTAEPRRLELPGGIWVSTTMKALHGPEMAKFAVAFVAALLGVFVMRSALQGDRRLVAAGFPAGRAIAARMSVLVTAVLIAAAVGASATAIGFRPASWPPLLVALVLTGMIYAAIGLLAGALLDKLAATYLILFLTMTDLGVVQTPMFHATPARLAWLLPGYGPTRVMLEGAYSPTFHATRELLLSGVWAIAMAAAACLVLLRTLGGTRHRVPTTRAITTGDASR